MIVVSVVAVVDDKAHYYPGADSFLVKMIADKTTGEFLGIQVLGKGAVDKMVDIAVVALSMKATVQQLEHLTLHMRRRSQQPIHLCATASISF